MEIHLARRVSEQPDNAPDERNDDNGLRRKNQSATFVLTHRRAQFGTMRDSAETEAWIRNDNTRTDVFALVEDDERHHQHETEGEHEPS